MRRDTHTIRRFDLEGSERSHGLAAAAAQLIDPDTLEALIQAKVQLDSLGGQIHIAAKRVKVDPATNAELEDYRLPGKYVTIGYVIRYEHIATMLRVGAEPDAPKGAPEELPLERPEPPEHEQLEGDEAEMAEALVEG